MLKLSSDISCNFFVDTLSLADMVLWTLTASEVLLTHAYIRILYCQ